MQISLVRNFSDGEAAFLSLLSLGASIAREVQQYRDEAERQRTIQTAKDRIRNSYPRELADRLISEFEASGNNLSFNFESAVCRYFDIKLYNFLLVSAGENFADSFFERKRKFEGFEVPTTLKDLLSRNLVAHAVTTVDASEMEAGFNLWLKKQQNIYEENFAKANAPNIDPAKQKRLKDAHRTTLIATSNVFFTDSGIALIVEDYRLVHIEGAQYAVYKNITDFQKQVPKNKKWDYISDERHKEIKLQPELERILGLLYGV
jgi:hypothetical protein